MQEFVRVLKTVPDYRPFDLPKDAVAILARLAEQTIEQIERQIKQGSDRSSTQQDLAAAIYDIRAALEEADRWNRHYAR